MNCQRCQEQLYPENPEVPQYNPHTKKWLPPLCQGCLQSQAPEEVIAGLEDRVGNLQAVSAESGRVPRRYYDQFQQIHGELAYLRNKVHELSAKPVRKLKLAEGVKL